MKKIRRTFDELVTITEVDARASYDASALRAAANQQGAGDRGMDGEMTIRPVRKSDGSALAALLNEIIARGETTALEEPFTPAGLGEAMLTGPAAYCCFVAEEAAGDLVGFQSLTRADHLPDGVADFGWLCYRTLAQSADGFWPSFRPST